MSPSAERSSTAGDALSAQMLNQYRARHGSAPARLGCGLVAHRDLGFCSACHEHGSSGEVTGWRLLAMAERGIPKQPFETDDANAESDR